METDVFNQVEREIHFTTGEAVFSSRLLAFSEGEGLSRFLAFHQTL